MWLNQARSWKWPYNFNWKLNFFSEVIFNKVGKTNNERRKERTWSTLHLLIWHKHTHLQCSHEDCFFSHHHHISKYKWCAHLSHVIYMNYKPLSSSCCAVELTMATSDKSIEISFGAFPLIYRLLRAALRHKFHFSKLMSAAWPRDALSSLLMDAQDALQQFELKDETCLPQTLGFVCVALSLRR